MIGAYRDPDRAKGKQLMAAPIESVRAGVPAVLTEIITLGRTVKKRAEDVLARFDARGTSNGPTEATNGRSAWRRLLSWWGIVLATQRGQQPGSGMHRPLRRPRGRPRLRKRWPDGRPPAPGPRQDS